MARGFVEEAGGRVPAQAHQDPAGVAQSPELLVPSPREELVERLGRAPAAGNIAQSTEARSHHEQDIARNFHAVDLPLGPAPAVEHRSGPRAERTERPYSLYECCFPEAAHRPDRAARELLPPDAPPSGHFVGVGKVGEGADDDPIIVPQRHAVDAAVFGPRRPHGPELLAALQRQAVEPALPVADEDSPVRNHRIAVDALALTRIRAEFPDYPAG